ncbi:hypothetical protein K461DRAFT_277621 [Myriangium duriaei CBS 260.36]|uniref:Uncharacterized protein n=1 Tax=Myriangium duriaei CBS 260.36 TaxID=1168546 RepID=A0A9P4J1S8_9PEZI|nr:hypothetical protein K461DRAFT_277621 [Myriangium duriaei CBS 260.36]
MDPGEWGISHAYMALLLVAIHGPFLAVVRQYQSTFTTIQETASFPYYNFFFCISITQMACALPILLFGMIFAASSPEDLSRLEESDHVELDTELGPGKQGGQEEVSKLGLIAVRM